MLLITVPAVELWDERNQEFVYTKAETLKLEHSLVSLSKWESRWRKPFFSKTDKTYEETLDYIRCMTLNPNVSYETYFRLTAKNINQIYEYMSAPMTATTFSKESFSRNNREIVTAELIYYWMIALNIPLECQKWHLNKLVTLIRVCEVKNTPPKKRSRKEIMNRNAALNAARKKKFNTKG
ncbi:MAG: hypothetical protein Q4P20_09460 [Eubacteriales bacterium]|nr:hypothetical protein [Eubacteriales bacterium]